MTAVLHTHTRRLEYHPHVHIIVPGGGVEREGSTTGWKTLSTRYLFNGRALAKVFRARLLVALRAAGLGLPSIIGFIRPRSAPQ